MIDLHMHTKYSDGTENCISVLKKCEEKKIDYISITEVLNMSIEILGYGIDYNKLSQLLERVYIPAEKRNLIKAKRLYDKCINYGIKLDNNCLKHYTPDQFASGFFHKEITKYDENRTLISDDAWNSSKILYRQLYEYKNNSKAILVYLAELIFMVLVDLKFL